MNPTAVRTGGRVRAVLAALMMVALLGGCSGGGDPAPEAGAKDDKKAAAGERKKGKRTARTTTTTAPDDEVAGATGDTGEVAPTTVPATGGGTPPTAPASSAENPFSPRPRSDEPPEVKVSLASACVPRGGVQTVTIRTDPATPVTYMSVYSDGQGAGDDGQSYGGHNIGRTDDSGRYRDSWTVSLRAPSGTVKVTGFASHGSGMGTGSAEFEVAGPLGTCN